MARKEGNNVSVGIKDWNGLARSILAYLAYPGAATVTQITAGTQAFCTALDKVTGAEITSLQYTLDITLPGGLKGGPVSGADAMTKIRASFPAANQKSPWGFDIYARDPACVSGGQPDTAEGASLDLLTDVMLAAATGGGTFVSSQGNALNGEPDCRQGSSHMRKQLNTKRKSGV
jgi:hypothetical protein